MMRTPSLSSRDHDDLLDDSRKFHKDNYHDQYNQK